jgi:hypothetical protein
VRGLEPVALPAAPCSPLPELLEQDAVGEALAADADSLQDAIAAQLVQNQPWLQLPGLQRCGGRGRVVSGGHKGAIRAGQTSSKPS